MQYSVLIMHVYCNAEVFRSSVTFPAAVKCCFNFSDNWGWWIQILNTLTIFCFCRMLSYRCVFYRNIRCYEKLYGTEQYHKTREVYRIFGDQCVIRVVHNSCIWGGFLCVHLVNAVVTVNSLPINADIWFPLK